MFQFAVSLFCSAPKSLCFIPLSFGYPAACCLSLGGGISLLHIKPSGKKVLNEVGALAFLMKNTLHYLAQSGSLQSLGAVVCHVTQEHKSLEMRDICLQAF